MNILKLFKQNFIKGGAVRVIITSLFATLACTGIIYAATTVGNNIFTTGTITGSGANTLYGATSIGGALTATSTLTVSGLTILGNASTTGIMTIGDSITDILYYNSGISQFFNNSTSTIQQNINSWSLATSTSATPIFSINGSNGYVGIGTTSPGAKLAVNGAILSSGSAERLTGTNGYIDFNDASTGLTLSPFVTALKARSATTYPLTVYGWGPDGGPSSYSGSIKLGDENDYFGRVYYKASSSGEFYIDVWNTVSDNGGLFDVRIANDSGGIDSKFRTDNRGFFKPLSASIETISNGGTITADACGGIKVITSAGNVNAGEADGSPVPITTCGVALRGCVMDIYNAGSATTTLKQTTSGSVMFDGGGDVALGPDSNVRVGCLYNGTNNRWVQLSAVEAN